MKLRVLAEGVIWKNPHPGSRSLVALKGHSVSLGGGEILHAMQVGQARTSRDSRCMVVRTSDYGKTWSAPTPIAIAGPPPTTASPRVLRDGTIWAGVVRNENVEPEDPRWSKENGGWVATENSLAYSTDGGRTWSPPQGVQPEPPRGGFHVLSSPVFELASGEFMLVFEPFATGPFAELDHEVAIVRSADRGTSWSAKTIIAKDPSGRLLYFDPRACPLNDGSWVCLYWTHDQHTDESLQTTISWSEDGHRWTAPQPTPLWGFLSLPLALKDGRLLAVYNHRRAPQGIRCCVSENAGRTWRLESEYVLWDQAQRRLTGEPATASQQRAWEGNLLAEMFTTFDFGVPHPVLLDDGSVFVAFYATQLDHIMHQRYVRFELP